MLLPNRQKKGSENICRFAMNSYDVSHRSNEILFKIRFVTLQVGRNRPLLVFAVEQGRTPDFYACPGVMPDRPVLPSCHI
jgi:hypothetical protein